MDVETKFLSYQHRKPARPDGYPFFLLAFEKGQEDEKDVLLEQNVSLKLNRLHFEPGYKRLSSGRFKWWPATSDGKITVLAVHELQLLLWNGNPAASIAGEMWKKIRPSAKITEHT